MALEHAQPLQPIRLRPLGDQLGGTPSTSLIKSAELQLLRVVLPAGQRLPAHWVAGECTVQCLEGQAVLATQDHRCALQAGDVVLVPAGQPHEVQALQDCALLVTIRLGP